MKWKLNDGHDKNKYVRHDNRNMIENCAYVWSSSGICIHPLVVSQVSSQCPHVTILISKLFESAIESCHSCHAWLFIKATLHKFHSTILFFLLFINITFSFSSRFPHFQFVSFHSFGLCSVQCINEFTRYHHGSPSKCHSLLRLRMLRQLFCVQSHPFYSALIGQCNILLLQCLHNAISCTFSEQDPCSGQMVYEYVCTHSVYRFSIVLYVLAKYLRSLHIDIPHRRTTTTSAHKPKIKKHPTVGKADKIRKYQGQCTDVHFGACFYVVRVLLMNRIQFILILNFCTKYGIASEIATSPILMLISSTYWYLFCVVTQQRIHCKTATECDCDCDKAVSISIANGCNNWAKSQQIPTKIQTFQ